MALGACGDFADTEDVGSLSSALCSTPTVVATPPGPVNAGTVVALAANGSTCGAGETAEYQFHYKREGTNDPFTVFRAYGTSASANWNTTGLASGKYQILVYTRAVGTVGQRTSYLNVLINNVCTSGSFAAAPPGPQAAGTPITLTGTASCTGGATPEFKYIYKRQDQSTYTDVGPYAAGPATWNTTGLSSGTYNLIGYIRAAGNASSSEGIAYLNYQIGSSCTAVTLGASPTSPQQPGTTVTLTGAASCGGSSAEYKFLYKGPSDATYLQIQGYGASATAPWNTTGLPPGTYSLLTQARVVGNGSSAEASGYLTYKLGASVTEIAAGAGHTCVLLNSGLKCFGRNLLGTPTGQYSYDRGTETADMGDALPVVSLGAGRTAKAMARGSYHACAILDNDTVKCWGRNSSGGLGDGGTNHRSGGELGDALPTVNLGTGRTAKQITAGGGFSCAILDNDSVKCWGDNTYGSLGQGDQRARGDGPFETGDYLPAVNLGTGRTATSLVAGVGHVCAILDNSSLKCWGLNNLGQLGLGDVNGRGDAAGEMGDSLPAINLGTGRTAKAVTLGAYHTCAILDNDTLKCWGQGTYGAIGSGDSATRGDGAGEMGDTLPIVNVGTGRTVKSVIAGGAHTCAILDNDALKCWGYNSDGQLGVGDLSNRGAVAGQMGDSLAAINIGTGRTARKVTAGYMNTCVEIDTGGVKCWGAAYTAMLGIGPSDRRGDSLADMGDALPAFSLGASAPVASFGTGLGYHFGCALLTNNTIKCWGSNSFGQLGSDRSSNIGDEYNDTGSTTNVSLGTGASVVAVAGGQYHSCALLADGRVKCWGANVFGSSGVGDTFRHDGRAAYMGNNLPAVDLGPGRTAKKIYVGGDHSCAILDDDTVKCWGSNVTGQLGYGDVNDRGDAAGEMGAALGVVQLGTGRTAKSLSLGYRHSCAVLDNGSLKCWGWNAWGQLGLGHTLTRGDQANQMGDSLPAISLGTGRTAVSVHAGYLNTCALLDDGSLKCWGDNTHGELGRGNNLWAGTVANSMGDNLPPINLGTGRTAKSVGVGSMHVCALLDNNTVKCWGYNAYGKLGYGDTTTRGLTAGQMGDGLPALDFGAGQSVASLAVGWDHNCVVLSGGGGSVRCWGNGDYGSLGYGDNVSRGDNAGEMGTALANVNLGDP